MRLYNSTVIAQCTPHGSGALALLRLSGPDALTVATKFARLSNGKLLDTVKTHTINHGFVINQQGDHIDEVMFLVMHGPKTFTGEHTVEVSCHNNPFIIQEIINQALAHGARTAQPGEFSQQAVQNNKIDLLQAEAINELIQATTQQALKKSLAQVEGSLSSWLQTLEQQLRKAHGLCEASFEFLDEEMNFDEQLLTIFTDIQTSLKQHRSSHKEQTYIRQGIKTALLGAVNAGKSSSFHTLFSL